MPVTNRFFFLFSVLFLTAVAALSANPLTLSLDQPDGRYYNPDEKVLLDIEIDAELLAERDWDKKISWQRNWVGEVEEQALENHFFAFPLKDEKPGQVLLTVSLTAKDDPSVTHKSSIGFLFQPEAIALSTPEPEDFDSFWEEQKESWRAKKQEISLTPVESPIEGISAWDLQIAIEGEVPVSGYLAIPENASEKSLPAILYTHGAGVRSSILSTAVRAANNGFLALDINAHGLPNGQSAEFYNDKATGELNGYPRHGFDSREDWYFRKMYLRVVTALDYLTSRPEWNGEDLVTYGSSQGGGQALAGAGLDDRVTVVAASVPALCDLTGQEDQRKPGWPQPGQVHTLDDAARENVLEAVGYFDGGIFARRIRVPVILSLGLADPVCPAVGIQATLNNLAGTAEAIYRPTMGHAFPAELRELFEDFIFKYVALPGASEPPAVAIP